MCWRRLMLIICSLFMLCLLGCSGNSHGSADSNQSLSSQNNECFLLSDFINIIPGRSTLQDVQMIYAQCGSQAYVDLTKYNRILPSMDGTKITVSVSIPEWVVYRISWHINDLASHDAIFVNRTVDITPIASAADFFSIIPGQSNYQDVYNICGVDFGGFPRSDGMHISVPVLNDCMISIRLDPDGVVSGIIYYCEIASIQVKNPFSLSDFYQSIPGKTTFAQIDDSVLEKGFLLGDADVPPPSNQKILLLPAKKGNRISIEGTWHDDRIKSITIENAYDTYCAETDETVVNISSEAVFRMMCDVIPIYDTQEKVSEICAYDFGNFPREKGLAIKIPMEKECIFIILLDPNGRVVSMSWQSTEQSTGDGLREPF